MVVVRSPIFRADSCNIMDDTFRPLYNGEWHDVSVASVAVASAPAKSHYFS